MGHWSDKVVTKIPEMKNKECKRCNYKERGGYPPHKWDYYDICDKCEKELKEKRHRARLRKEVLERDKICQICFKEKPQEIHEVDHIIPISEGGTDDLDNLQLLCYKCHKKSME